ncbi:MAG: hypothetical protein K1X78_27065 [Verrucomicrobiaceae bacterium]|nr:hypothetical protein [Verrucomicrobiaceae bacterium]
MKTARSFRFLSRVVVPLAFALITGQVAAQVSVTATAGTPGPTSYTTLKDAFDAVNAGTHQGAVTMSVTANTTETAPAVLSASGTGSASYTSVGISPSGGSARTISGAIAAGSPLIDLDGADNVTIDGLNTGGNSLTIANTTVSATAGTSTIRFINGATGNVITNCNLQGSVSSTVATTGAVVFFSTDAATVNGNDNNTISNNNIGPAGSNLPSKAIQGSGSTTTTAIGNSGIVINNNNIFDFFNASITSAGVATIGGCNTWSITNNRFFQTGTRTWTASVTHRAMDIGNTTSTSGAQGFTITGNIIGYANSLQTGTYTLTGAGVKFAGIAFNGINGGAVTNINNNTVTAVSMTGVISSGTSTTAPFIGILAQTGVINTNNNTIGSQSATGALTFSTTTTTNTDVYGIYNFTSDNWTSNNNTIGGISVTNAGASGNFVVFGMRANITTTTSWSATSNLVGGTVADSIQLNATGAASQVVGMQTSNAAALLTSNTVRNLANNIGTGTSTSASVIGISIAGSVTSHTLSQNAIFELRNSNPTAASAVTGIQFTGSTANVVERNAISRLSVATTSAAAEINGIRVAAGTTVYRNNMIAIGAATTNAIGAAASNASTTGINGINEAGGTNSFFHNSIYIGGSALAGTGASYAFNSTVAAGTRSVRDNIFYNARSNGGATGSHYAIKLNGTTPNPAGLTIDNNLYFANGSVSALGFFNSLDVAHLPSWQTVVGQDFQSLEANPQFLDPTNLAPDLHLSTSVLTPAEGNGVDVGVTNDFDGQTRSGLTPVDIGADAGGFIFQDLIAPVITFTPIPKGSTTNYVLPVTIRDVVAVATGPVAPRIYFRKNGGAYVSTAATLFSGTVQNGVWNCTLDYALLGGVVVTDAIDYFVVAQDTAGNVACSSFAGFSGSSVNTIISPPTSPPQYSILPAINGSFNVGTGETYTSLTNAGGIFEAINNSAVNGNLTINITSDLTGETGAVSLNEFTIGFTLVIRPSGAPRAITGSSGTSLIRLNEADNVTIDGSTTGASAPAGVGGSAAIRELTITNTSTAANTIVIGVSGATGGAQNNTFKNLNVLGADPTTSLAGIALGGASPVGAGVDNDNNRIENCSIQKVIFGIVSTGASAANPNTGTVIRRNDLSAAGTSRVRRVGISVSNDDGAQITENSVGGLDTNEAFDAIGIALGIQLVDATTTVAGGVTNASVSRNKINGVNQSTTFSAVGIAVAGGAGVNTIANNMISGVIANSTSPDIPAGIYVAGVAGSTTRVLANSISMTGNRGATANQFPSYGIAITGTDPTVELRDNIFSNIQDPGSGGASALSFAIGMATGTFANLTSNNNVFYSAGPLPGFFRTGALGAGLGTNLATLAAWQAATGKDANSFFGDPLFVSTTDLHITNTSSPAFNAGAPIAGVTADLDGEARNAATPDIGADEFSAADYIVTTTGNAIVVTDLSGNGDTLVVTEPSAGNIKFAAAGRNFSVDGGAFIAGDSGNLPLAGVTSITVNGAGGDDTINVGAFSGASFPSLTINGGTGNDTVNMNGSIALASGASLDLDLQNDDAAPGTDTVNLGAGAVIDTSGTGAITAKASRRVTMTTGAKFTTVDGGVTLEGNQQAVTTTGNFPGVRLDGATIQSTGTGQIVLKGRGGVDPTNGANVGISINSASVVSTIGADITFEGRGSASTDFAGGIAVRSSSNVTTSGAGNINLTGVAGPCTNTLSRTYGIYMDTAGTVTSTGTGPAAGGITMHGTGGTGVTFCIGVVIVSTGTGVSAVDGDISITGISGNGTGTSNDGVDIEGLAFVRSTGTGANAGNITLDGTGGLGTFGSLGVILINQSEATVVDGDLTITGAGGGGTGPYNEGVGVFGGAALRSTGTGAGAGTITIDGTGNGAAGGTESNGVSVRDAGSLITSVDGAVSITGTPGTGASTSGVRIGYNAGVVGAVTSTGTAPLTFNADSMFFDTGATIDAGTSIVTLRQKTNGTQINLGGADAAGVLGLTDAELDHVTAATLNIGDANTGMITISAAISRAAITNMNFASGADIVQQAGVDTLGGDVNVSAGSVGGHAYGAGVPGTEFAMLGASTGTLSFGSGPVLSLSLGSLASHEALDVNGKVNLTGLGLDLTGTWTPVFGDVMTIVNNDGTDAITGTFTGQPEGSIVIFNGEKLRLSYLGGTGNDVALTVLGEYVTVAGALALNVADFGAPSTVPGTLADATVVAGNVTFGDGDSVQMTLPAGKTVTAASAVISNIVGGSGPGVNTPGIIRFKTTGGTTLSSTNFTANGGLTLNLPSPEVTGSFVFEMVSPTQTIGSTVGNADYVVTLTIGNVTKVPAPVPSGIGDVVTGAAAPNASGADSGTTFDVLRRGGFLATDGTVVFPGNLLVGTGGVTLSPNNFMGLWKDGGTGLKLLARSGDAAPQAGTPAAAFDVLPTVPAINESGQVTFLASLAIGSGSPAATVDDDTGIWSELGGTGLQLLMRENDDVPGLTGIKVGAFASGAFATAKTGATTGEAAFCVAFKGASADTAMLRTSIVANDILVGIVARENSPAPGLSGETFGILTGNYSDPPRMDAAGNLAMCVQLKPSNRDSIWYQPVSGGTPVKVFAAGTAATGEVAPGTSGATFQKLYRPSIGGNGTLCFRALLNNNGDNSAGLANDGIWEGDVTNGFTCILRRGDDASKVIGLPGGAKVGNLWNGWLTATNRGAWKGWVDMDGNGSSAAPNDVHGIYTDLEGFMELLVKVGDSVTDIPGATFASMDLPVLADAADGQESEYIAFLGTVSGAGINAGNNKGLWRANAVDGQLHLALRTGDTMVTSQGTKTIANIDLPGSNTTDRRWEQPVMDGHGRILVLVTFVGGSTAQVIVP